jgi:GNAT superfamily N-acetyltransferase
MQKQLACDVRPARAQDLKVVVSALSALLNELGAVPPELAAMQAAAGALLESERTGVLLVADVGGQLVGVLAASWQVAIHVPGRYALIQDIWVDPAWRSQAVGHSLLQAFAELARAQGVRRIEVGLPREHFVGLAATDAFYRREGFTTLGSRMQRRLA